jgi:hypothetical protein
MSNAYAEVIDLLNTGAIDYRRIAIELAKTSPSLFLRLHHGAKPNVLSPEVVRNIRSLIHSEQLISAIKTLRIATVSPTQLHGLGLKEARDIIFAAAGREQFQLDKAYLVYVNEIKG